MNHTPKTKVPRCPSCGQATWEVVGKLHAWRALKIETDDDGNERLVPDGDLDHAGEGSMLWTSFDCYSCGAGTTTMVRGGNEMSADDFIAAALDALRRDLLGEDLPPPYAELEPWSLR